MKFYSQLIQKYGLASNKEIANAKLLKSEDMYNLTEGKIDKRNQFEKVKDEVLGIAGNVAMGVESVIPSTTKYINTLGEVGTAKAGSQIMQKLFNTDKETSEIIGKQVFSKLWDTTEISKANKELNSEDLEKWRKETITNNTNKTSTPLGRKISEIAPSVGQNIVPMAVSYFNPIAGTSLFMSSAAGSYLDDAEERGMNKEQALTYATVMGTFEGATEQVISGKMLSNSMKLFNGVGLSDEVLNSFGVSTAENFFQEAIMEPLQETTATVVGGEDKANWDDILNRSLEAGVDGILSSILLNGASVGIASASNVVNKKNPTQKEIQVAIEDTINSKKVDIKSIIEGAKEAIEQGKDFINSDYNTLLQQNSIENQNNPQTVQITNQVNKVAQNGNMEQTDNNLANNQQTVYNNTESEGGINGQSQFTNQQETANQSVNEGGIWRDNETMRREEQGRSTTDIKNSKGQDSSSRVLGTYENKQTIEEAYNDKKTIKKTIEYANKNKELNPSREIIEVQNRAKEIGINVIAYKGKEGNKHLGLLVGNNVYLDMNKNNISIEDGSAMNRFSHEVLHYIKRNTSFKDTINELQTQIIKQHPEIIDNFVNYKGYGANSIPEGVRLVLVEEALGDYSAKHLSGYDIDYRLPEDITYTLNTTIDDAITELKLKNTNDMEPVREDISPYRTMEEIANDNTISDIQAFQEATKQLDTPSDKILQQRENKLSSQEIERSPTIDYIKQKRSKEKTSLTEIKDTLVQKFVNKGHYIDKLAKQTGNNNLIYLYDRTMNTFNEAQISIGDYQINSNGEKVGKSIIDIFEPAKKANLSLEFDDYLLNKHNVSRYAHEKGVFGDEISAIDSKKIVEHYENKYPDFREWSNEVSKYNDNNLRDLVDNGMVSEETYKKLKEMYGDYVPTYRDITDNISQYIDDSVGGNTLGKATQSDREILSISESMAEQTLAIKKAVRINNLGIELYNSLGKNSEITNIENFDPIAMQTLAGNVIEKATDGTNIFTIFIDGEMKQFRISDELYTAFAKDTLQNKINNSKVAKVLLTPFEKISKAQRELLTTYNIGFAMRNPWVDFQDALFNSKYGGATFVKNWTKALYNIGTKGSWYQSLKITEV